MRTDPEPQIAVIGLPGQRAVTQADANGSIASDLLELKGWMLRITFEKGEIGVGQPSNLEWQCLVGGPEFR